MKNSPKHATQETISKFLFFSFRKLNVNLVSLFKLCTLHLSLAFSCWIKSMWHTVCTRKFSPLFARCLNLIIKNRFKYILLQQSRSIKCYLYVCVFYEASMDIWKNNNIALGFCFGACMSKVDRLIFDIF